MFIETKLRRISNMRPQTSPQERRSVLRLLRCTLSTVLLLQIHTRHQRPWRSPTKMRLNGNASARNTTNIIRYIEYTKGSIDYYNSLHSGFPPPDQEETENDRERRWLRWRRWTCKKIVPLLRKEHGEEDVQHVVLLLWLRSISHIRNTCV